MTINYEINTTDYIEFYKRYFRKRLFIFQNIIFVVAGAIAIYLGFNKLMFNILIINGSYKIPGSLIGDNIFLTIIYDFLFIIGIVFLIRYIFLNKIITQYKRARHLIGYRALTLNDDSLTLVTTDTRLDYKYRFVYSLELIKGYCYLNLCDRNSIIIPDNTKGFEDFINQLKEKINDC